MKKKILRYPNPDLSLVSDPVLEFDSGLNSLLKDMLDTLESSGGIGLAAPQIGVRKRVVIAFVGGELLIIINPKIEVLSNENHSMAESCLSVPGVQNDVERPRDIILTYTDIDGNLQEKRFFDTEASIIQHEVDHLDGILYVDHLSKMKKRLLTQKSMKAKTKWN